MPTAVIAAGIGAAGMIGGSLISSGAQSDAAQTNAQTASNTQAQQQAFLSNLYQQNTANETPYLNSGYGAQAIADQLLGIAPLTAQQFNSGQWLTPGSYQPTTPTGPAPASAPGSTGAPGTGTPASSAPLSGNALWNAYLTQYPDVMQEAQKQVSLGKFPSVDAYAQWHYQTYGATDGHTLPTAGNPTPTYAFMNGAHPTNPAAAAPTSATTAPATATATKPVAGYNGVPMANASYYDAYSTEPTNLASLGSRADSTIGRALAGPTNTPGAVAPSGGGPYTYPSPVGTPTPISTPAPAPAVAPTPATTPTAPTAPVNTGAHPIVSSPTAVAPGGNPFAGLPTNYGSSTGGATATSPGVHSITDMIRATPGYQFQVQQGENAINSNAYAHGIGNSGLTMKALQTYGQNTADSYYNQYLNNVMGVASGGAGAAGALAGVSQNYGNNVTTGMQNSALAQMQAATAGANATGSLASGIASGLGTLASGIGNSNLFGSSYGNTGGGFYNNTLGLNPNSTDPLGGNLFSFSVGGNG